ncbi:hypothetical protein OSC52_00190 [Clostridium pasteurianum]|uniref:hypothetical protein n=1 Tax=Clostridium pasteurianum TaxID=1501 RepID=UPI002260AD79|nr:hypothetical protein [Clostridium pasteurianum]UZW14327.1 hypothetical protein OSC52_00190 [Clostridium pasteurianum]
MIKTLIYKLFKSIVLEECKKELNTRFEQEKNRIADEYEEFDFDEFYRKAQEEDYTEELREQGII